MTKFDAKHQDVPKSKARPNQKTGSKGPKSSPKSMPTPNIVNKGKAHPSKSKVREVTTKKVNPKPIKAKIPHSVSDFDASVVIVPYSKIRPILEVDASICANTLSEFIPNMDSYFIVINMWLNMVEDYSHRGRLALQDQICHAGLFSCIADTSQLSDDMIHDVVDPLCPGYLKALYEDILCIPRCAALQVLRFPKRFSPLGASVIERTSISAFKITENTTKMRSRIENNQWIIPQVSSILSTLLQSWRMHYDPLRFGYFSPGEAFDSSKPVMHKLHAALKSYPRLLPLQFGIPVTEYTRVEHVSRIQAVPKSYKSARIIAHEEAGRQFYMQALRYAMRKSVMLSKYAECTVLDDQRQNYQMARFGSIHGDFATLDLSHASDSVSEVLVRDLVKDPQLLSEMFKYLPRIVEYPDGKRATLHMFATSGTALTFDIEDFIFLSIGLFATELYEKLGHKLPRIPMDDEARTVLGKEYFPNVSVYGDDCICRTEVAPLYIEILTCLGFTVNESKSFFSEGPGYRESCGGEFLEGKPVHSQYYSRKPLDLTNDYARSLAALCQLQHRVYHLWTSNLFITRLIEHVEPRITAHTVGVESTDLWMDTSKCRFSPNPNYSSGPNVKDVRQGFLSLRTIPDPSIKCNKACCAPDSLWHVQRAYDTWRYMQFLLHGPRFDDALSELLGVSTPDPSLMNVTAGSTQVLDWVYEI